MALPLPTGGLGGLPTHSQNAIISLKYIFGINTRINERQMRNHVHFLNDNRIIYPAGYNVVSYNLEDKSQYFFPGNCNRDGSGRGISAIQVSASKKYLAVAERKDRPEIYMYETAGKKRRKFLSVPESNFKEYIAMAFAPSVDNTYFACMSGGPDHTLFYYSWDKPKLIDEIIVTAKDIYEIAISPIDHTFISVLGEKLFKCYRLIENKLKAVHSQINGAPSNVSQKYTCHTWLADGNVIVCTSMGEIILLNNYCEYVMVLTSSPMKTFSIECVVATQKGFIIGGDYLTAYVYEATKDPDCPYDKLNVLQVKSSEHKDIKIKSMSMKLDDTKLGVLGSNNCIYTVNLENEVNEIALKEENVFEAVSDSFHTDVITGMDLCLRRPLIVTCSNDKTIRVWNYEENILECSHTFSEDLLSVAFHPSGFHIAVGSDKLRLMNLHIVHNNNNHQIRMFKEIGIKGCKEVRFSHGGQYFAATLGANNQSHHHIYVYRFYTGEDPPHLQFRVGHHGRIRCLEWSKDDDFLYSCGWDGLVYKWEMKDGNRSDLQSFKGTQATCLAVSNDMKSIYVAASDESIKDMTGDGTFKKHETGLIIGQLALTNSNKMLFAGIDDRTASTAFERTAGNIRCYKLPITGHYDPFPGHDSAGIEKMRVTHDDHYLITAGKDGVIIVYEIRDKEIRGIKLRDGISKYADEILITKGDIDDLRNKKQGEETSLQDAKQRDTGIQLNSRDETIKQLREQLLSGTQNDKAKYEELLDAKKKAEQEHIDHLNFLKDTFETEIQELESTHQKNIMTEVGKYDELKRQLEENNSKYEGAIEQLKMQHNLEMKDIDELYTTKIEEEQTAKARIELQMKEKEKKQKEILNQIEDETKEEIEKLEKKNRVDIKAITDQGLKSRNDETITQKKKDQQEQEELELQEKQKEYELRKDELKKSSLRLNEEILAKKELIRERDTMITEKERRIYDLKKRTQELEKFKYVLDYKIKELKRDIGPREEEINEMKKKTNEMDNELKKLNQMNNTLGLVVDELDRKQTDMQKDIKEKRADIRDQNIRIKAFKDAVFGTVRFIQDYKKLREETEKLKAHVKNEVKNVEIDPDIYAEYLSQKKYLKTSVKMLKKNLQKDNEIHRQDNLRIMRENVDLIREINQLRNEIKEIKHPKDAKKIEGFARKRRQNSPDDDDNPSDKLVDLAEIKEKKAIINQQKNEIESLERKLSQIKSHRNQPES